VPLVAAARGGYPELSSVEYEDDPTGATSLAFERLLAGGRQEGWLGRPDVLLLVDLPLRLLAYAARLLARHRVRPVLLVMRWPEPGAVLPPDDSIVRLLEGPPKLSTSEVVQSAFLLEAERYSSVSREELTRCFDNRYTLGSIDLPSEAGLCAAGVRAAVALWAGSGALNEDLDHYLTTLATAGMPVWRFPVAQRT
jgi:hypothetical protein